MKRAYTEVNTIRTELTRELILEFLEVFLNVKEQEQEVMDKMELFITTHGKESFLTLAKDNKLIITLNNNGLEHQLKVNLLHYAVSRNCTKTAQKLIDIGVDIVP
jgi:hypothetical protein